jgi:uncharacterized protein YecT (DUF1311 family)
MRSTLIAAGVVLGAASAQAADCRDAASQAEMNVCASKAYEKADAELNAAYRELKERAQEETAKLLVAAQRAWVTFRDAECAFAASGSAGGSVQPMVVSNCLEDITRKRTTELKAYLDCKEGDLACLIPRR